MDGNSNGVEGSGVDLNLDSGLSDLNLSPGQVGIGADIGIGGGQGDLSSIEKALLSDDEDDAAFTVTIPTGRTLKIYPKSDGQLRKCNAAFYDWMDAEFSVQRRMEKIGGFAFWRWWRRSVLQKKADVAKDYFFQQIFTDKYIHARHQEVTAEELLTIPIDQQAAIYIAYRKANDPEPLLRAILGDRLYEAKKKLLDEGVQRVFTPS